MPKPSSSELLLIYRRQLAIYERDGRVELVEVQKRLIAKLEAEETAGG